MSKKREELLVELLIASVVIVLSVSFIWGVVY